MRFCFIDANDSAVTGRSSCGDTESEGKIPAAQDSLSEYSGLHAADASGPFVGGALQRHAAATKGDSLQIIAASGDMGSVPDRLVGGGAYGREGQSEGSEEGARTVRHLEAWAGQGEGDLRAPSLPGLYKVKYYSAVCGGISIGEATFQARLRQQPAPLAEGGWVRAFVVHDAASSSDEARFLPTIPSPQVKAS